MAQDKHTPGPWKLSEDAQGPCTVFHPTRGGVAIANLSANFAPVRGYHDWHGNDPDRATIAERNANARLIASAPETAAERDRLKESNAELVELLRNRLSLVELKFGNTDPTANAAIEQANTALANARSEDPGALTGCADDLRGALSGLAADVEGCWTAFEPEIRQAVSNTNYQIILDRIESARAALAKVGAE